MVRLKGINDLPMFFGASKEIMKRARELRNNPTEAEKKLWNALSGARLDGMKFRRQHPINNFIADFYCHSKKLVIEVDGPVHEKREKAENDKLREEIIREFDIKILRFKNFDVLSDIEGVKREIISFLNY